MYNLYDLKASDIRKKYDDNYLKEGKKLIEELKRTSNSYSSFLQEHIKIEDII
jgi:hypothetical protein